MSKQIFRLRTSKLRLIWISICIWYANKSLSHLFRFSQNVCGIECWCCMFDVESTFINAFPNATISLQVYVFYLMHMYLRFGMSKQLLCLIYVYIWQRITHHIHSLTAMFAMITLLKYTQHHNSLIDMRYAYILSQFLYVNRSKYSL